MLRKTETMTRSTKATITLAATVLAASSCEAFVGPRPTVSIKASNLIMGAEADADVEEPKMNPDNPNLPELKGDFDWDAEYAGDDDWITENVPGKIVLDEITLAKQVTALNELETKWARDREFEAYEESRNVGWTEKAELANGRFAMFFLVTGLLTEYWTGVSLPGQVEEMLRIGGFIGFD